MNNNPKVSVIVPIYNVENYMRPMLESVRNQRFRDFEVILVNDGSKDGSQQIIDEYCELDDRFIGHYQENAGVSAARNTGIGLAKGEYIAFYDPDDYVPVDALGKMYRRASNTGADMVIGVAVEQSLGEKIIYQNSQKLAKQKDIRPDDQHFFKAWAIWHKLFRRQFLLDNDLKYEGFINAEDGVFTYCCLNKAQKITGCDVVAYEYYKRPFWETPSATQIVSNRYLEGLLASHKRIMEEARKISDKPEYLEPLYVRYIENELINGYYRGIWRAESDMTARLQEKTDEYRQHITDESWNKLLRRHWDLELENGFMTQEELNKKPILSILLTADIDEDKLNLMIGSIFNQAFSRFELLIDANIKHKVSKAYLDKLNVKVCARTKLLEEARGEYVAILDEYLLYTRRSLELMINRLHRNKSLDFVSVLIKQYDGAEYKQLPSISAEYNYVKAMNRFVNPAATCDVFVSNKVFRKDSISYVAIPRDIKSFVKSEYSLLSFDKLRKGVMITDMSDAEIRKRAGLAKAGLNTVVMYATNEGTRRAIEKVKRLITREDIDRLLKR